MFLSPFVTLSLCHIWNWSGQLQEILGGGRRDLEPSSGPGMMEAQAPGVEHLAVRVKQA